MKPISPKNCREYLALVQMADAAQMSEEVRSFLSEIDAPGNLTALLLVCSHVREALEEARSAWGLSSEISALVSWDKPLMWLLSTLAANDVPVECKPALKEFTSDRHPLWGWGLRRYPTYSALCNSTSNGVKSSEYRLLQAHLMLANALLMRRHAPVAPYEAYDGDEEILKKYAQSNPAAFAVRLIGLKPSYLDTLDPTILPQDFAEHCRDLESGEQISVEVTWGPKSSTHQFHAGDLAIFLEKALEEREQATINASSHYGPGNRLWVSGGISEFDFLVLQSGEDIFDHFPRGTTHTSRKRFSVNRKSADELIALDDDPLEDEDSEEADDTDMGDPWKDQEPGDYQEVSTSWANHVEMANQQFSWTFGSLVPEELKELLVIKPSELLSAAQERELTQVERLDFEVLAFIQVMFWTGSSIERTRNLKVVDAFSEDKDDELLLKPATDSDCARWRIRAPLPDYKQEQTEPVHGVDRDRTTYLELPDVASASDLVFALRALQESEAASEQSPPRLDPTRVFRAGSRQYRAAVNRRCGDNERSPRLNAERISKCMVQRVLLDSRGDYSATAIVTGSDLNLATVRLFYACRSVRKLQRRYLKSALTLSRSLGRILPDRKGRPKISLEKPNIYIGNRICPTLESLKEAVLSLIDEIRACEERTRESDAVDHHNLFTLYTIWFFSYTTGIRGIRTPYLPITEIDRKSGIATITDKDTGLGYRTKLTWISPDLIKQMDSYQDFLSRSLRFPKEDSEPIVRRSVRIEKSNPWPCFFVDDQMNPLAVRPKTLEPIMRKFLSFPVNIHRRVVSSELLDRGCPPEVVSAWMGHWHRGEEPWARFSTFAFSEYRHCLEQYLVPFLSHELGFDVVNTY